jgi:hypothetical protein
VNSNFNILLSKYIVRQLVEIKETLIISVLVRRRVGTIAKSDF